MNGTEFQDYDLCARVFGAGLGAVYGFLAGVGYYLVASLANCSIMRISVEKQKTVSHWTVNAAYFLMFLLVTMTVSAYVGYETGKCVDLDYYRASQADTEKTEIIPTHFPLRFFLILLPVFAGLSIARVFRVSENRAHASAYAIRMTIRVFFIVLCITAVFYDTERLTRPNLTPRPAEPEEGIYVYSNDTVYGVFPLNIYSSRMSGFEHTGLCLLTRRPGEINARRLARKEKSLHFEMLDRGNYMSDLNLEVTDHDGLMNHGSRTTLDDAPYLFDMRAMNHFLAGRSANDRLKPAIKLHRVEVSDPAAAWDEVVRFRNEFNEKYPEGFIYSPVPYRAKHATLYNCNTVTAAILGGILGQGNRYDFITAMPGCVGGQTAADGKKMLEDMMTHDRKPEIARQREWMATGPFSRQAFFHRLAHKGGWLYALAGSVRTGGDE